jgi:hypothetical protein
MHMKLIRTLTDSQRAQLGYGGPAVLIDIGVDVADAVRNTLGPSASVLTSYKREFSSDGAYEAFLKEIISQPTGTALGGRLTWRT